MGSHRADGVGLWLESLPDCDEHSTASGSKDKDEPGITNCGESAHRSATPAESEWENSTIIAESNEEVSARHVIELMREAQEVGRLPKRRTRSNSIPAVAPGE